MSAVDQHAPKPTDASDELEGGRDVEPCAALPLPARIEAILVSSDRPLTESRLAEILGLDGAGSTKRVAEAIGVLRSSYDDTGRAATIMHLAGGWQVLTRPEFGPLLGRLHRDRQQSRLSPAALETLAIVAYRQPVIRAEIEAIRGVSCGEVLRGLLERRLVKIAGRAEEIGRPMLYGTTKEFLTVFGLASVDDLPSIEGDDRPRRRQASPPRDAEPEPEASKGDEE